jgi:hypothetical protein
MIDERIIQGLKVRIQADEVSEALGDPRAIKENEERRQILKGLLERRKTPGPAAPSEAAKGLADWHSEWATVHPNGTDLEALEAAREYHGAAITRRQVEALRRPADGTPRKRGPKAGKSYAGPR